MQHRLSAAARSLAPLTEVFIEKNFGNVDKTSVQNQQHAFEYCIDNVYRFTIHQSSGIYKSLHVLIDAHFENSPIHSALVRRLQSRSDLTEIKKHAMSEVYKALQASNLHQAGSQKQDFLRQILQRLAMHTDLPADFIQAVMANVSHQGKLITAFRPLQSFFISISSYIKEQTPSFQLPEFFDHLLKHACQLPSPNERCKALKRLCWKLAPLLSADKQWAAFKKLLDQVPLFDSLALQDELLFSIAKRLVPHLSLDHRNQAFEQLLACITSPSLQSLALLPSQPLGIAALKEHMLRKAHLYKFLQIDLFNTLTKQSRSSRFPLLLQFNQINFKPEIQVLHLQMIVNDVVPRLGKR